MKIKIRDENKLKKEFNDLQTNLIKILDELDKSDKVEILKNKVINCNDLTELLELANQTLELLSKM